MEKHQAGSMVSFRLRKEEDEKVLSWMNIQTTLSDSLRFLIEQTIQKDGLIDLSYFITTKREILPSSTEIYEPLLRKFYEKDDNKNKEGLHISEMYDDMAKDFNLSDDVKNKKAITTDEPQWHNNVRWGKEILKNKGLVLSPKRGYWKISEAGRAYIEQKNSIL